ncbi:hypothetical protein B0F90DRAFT_1695946 [Multifurca ochricompacta]|uniref:Uncharacterized protein n=1 Tax=Multifurca ochricompacta TaxID=376703 RepID=A0AAD4QRH9_9AGAM|nr:hypothetical protein B0F90DRAFT_1695946 [Multifurca ochricompacta]
MSYEPGFSSSSSGSERPDRPLVVKCDYNSQLQKLSFNSARNCTYDGLKEKIEKRFALTALPFTIQWEDQDGEQIDILNELTLDEAIDYYNSGDAVSIASSGSVFGSRGSSRHHKITMQVQIRVDYDGPSLSDTSSLASREEGSPERIQLHLASGELESFPQDDDAMTVSSKDTHGLSRQGRTDSSLFKRLLNGGPRSGGSSTQSRSSLKPSRSRIFNFGSRTQSAEEGATGRKTDERQLTGRGSDSPTDTERAYPDDPLAVFERLKLEEERGTFPSYERPMLQTDIGKAWLQDQRTLRVKATIAVPAPSISDDTFSLITDTPFSDADPDMDISLQKDERGKYYYNYKGSSSSESAGGLEYEVVVNGSQSTDNDAGFLPEFLVPENVTDCSECGRVLDQIKYVCTTCGEKTPTSRAALAAAAANKGKGKSRAFPDHEHYHHGHNAEFEIYGPEYPPLAHRSPATPYTFTDRSNIPMHSSSYKPLPAWSGLGSQTTLVTSTSSGSSSSSTRVGYELCAMCFVKVGSPSSPTAPPTPQDLAIARRSAPKRKGQLRHASWSRFGALAAGKTSQDEISHHCSGCQSLLSGNRYKCGICDNFTICRACYSDVHNIHPIHPFLAMKVKPTLRSYGRSELLNGARTYDNTDEQSLRHPDVRCFNCQQDIIGPRFRCVDCTTIDIDICSDCDSAGLPGNLDSSDGGHNSSHIMLKIPVPLDMHEVQHVSQRAHGLRNGRDRADLRGVSPLLRSSPGSISSISPGTVSYDDEGGGDIEEDYVHLQTCNSCHEPIIGVRYQCLNCSSKPSSFNLCSACEVKSYKVHDPMHVFLKVPRPVDIPGPLESEFPIIPVLYRDPAGPGPGSPPAGVSGDPAAYLRDLTHAFALCDRHMMRIVGKWYRCAFCAKDLCADCEQLDTHDGTHVFLVFKAPVDMQAFRHFADLENQAGSPPVLHGKIYYPRHD